MEVRRIVWLDERKATDLGFQRTEMMDSVKANVSLTDLDILLENWTEADKFQVY